VWWQYIIIAAVILLGIYGFLTFTRFETRLMSRRTDRTVESMYPGYADSLRKQRRWVQKHGGEPAGDDGGRSREPKDTQPPEHGQFAAGGPGSGSA
jgi:hypothetical protein